MEFEKWRAPVLRGGRYSRSGEKRDDERGEEGGGKCERMAKRRPEERRATSRKLREGPQMESVQFGILENVETCEKSKRRGKEKSQRGGGRVRAGHYL